MTGATAVSAKGYILIWAWLAGLMLLGVVLSEAPLLPLPRWGVILTVVVLSTVKALLVALYYMHLKVDRRLLAFIAVSPLILIGLALALVWTSTLFQF